MAHKFMYLLCSIASLSGAFFGGIYVAAPRKDVPQKKQSPMEYMTRNIECEEAKAGKPPGVFVVRDQMGITITCMK